MLWTEDSGDTRVLNVQGDLTYTDVADLKDFFSEQLSRKTAGEDYVIDLCRCGFIDSGCLGMLAEFKKETARKGCSLRIVNVSDDVMEMMKRIRFDTIMSVSGRTEKQEKTL